jgi:quercetin dioxygenase-like cupin family protein
MPFAKKTRKNSKRNPIRFKGHNPRRISRQRTGGIMDSKTAQTILQEIKAQPANLRNLVQVSADSIVSKILLDKPAGSLTLFAFDKGQRLSKHTSPYDAVVQIIEGTAELIIGGRKITADAGQIVIMPAGIPHAVNAPVPFKMLLTMIRQK